VEAGNAAGCKTILLNNGNETEWQLTKKRNPSFIKTSWQSMIEIILLHEKKWFQYEQPPNI